jgi:hypothetical protein
MTSIIRSRPKGSSYRGFLNPPSTFKATEAFQLGTAIMAAVSSNSISSSFLRDSSPLSSIEHDILVQDSTLSLYLDRLQDQYSAVQGGAVIFHKDYKQDFIGWWCMTPWYGTNSARPRSDRMNIQRGSQSHKSTIWEHFSECALKSTGEPYVLCKRCSLRLHHPTRRSVKDGEISYQKTCNGHLNMHLKS